MLIDVYMHLSIHYMAHSKNYALIKAKMTNNLEWREY
jgi:hypothetical protein